MVPETPAVQMASQIGSSRFRISEPYAERLHKIAMLGSGFSCHPACDKWETHPSRSPRRVTPRETRLCNHPSTVNNKRRPSRLERLVFPTHSLFKFKFTINYVSSKYPIIFPLVFKTLMIRSLQSICRKSMKKSRKKYLLALKNLQPVWGDFPPSPFPFHLLP